MQEKVAVWALALGQTLGYACYFYVFAALVLDWQRDLPWSHGLLAAGPMLAIGTAAVLSPRIGRWVDSGQTVRLMVAGSAVGAGALSLLAMASHPAMYLLAFAGLGAAQALCLYEVCFGLLIRKYGSAARGPITKVTLVAGLASTLAFPAGAWLAHAYGWRMTVWIAAAVALFVILPLHLWGARVLAVPVVPRASGAAPRPSWRQIIARPGAQRLMLLFAVVNLDHWMLIGLLRPLLADMSVADTMGILAAAMVGPAQVLGRLALMGAGERLAPARATILTVIALIAAAACLLLAGVIGPALFAFAAFQGAAMGVMTILRPLLVAEVSGAADYGAASAILGLPGLAATAVAPMLGTVLLGAGGAALAIWTALGLTVLALVLALRRAV